MTDSPPAFPHLATYTTARLQGLIVGHTTCCRNPDWEFVRAVQSELDKRPAEQEPA